MHVALWGPARRRSNGETWPTNVGYAALFDTVLRKIDCTGARGSGASARVGGGLTVRLCDCYRYVIGECLPLVVGGVGVWLVGLVERVDGVVFW